MRRFKKVTGMLVKQYANGVSIEIQSTVDLTDMSVHPVGRVKILHLGDTEHEYFKPDKTSHDAYCRGLIQNAKK